jgi:hypothetical protein
VPVHAFCNSTQNRQLQHSGQVPVGLAVSIRGILCPLSVEPVSRGRRTEKSALKLRGPGCPSADRRAARSYASVRFANTGTLASLRREGKREERTGKRKGAIARPFPSVSNQKQQPSILPPERAKLAARSAVKLDRGFASRAGVKR